MTTPLLHVIAAFVVLVILDRLLNCKIPLEHLILLSLGAILPDLLDKTLTGSRYPFHSLIISGVILILLNIAVRYYINSRFSFSSKYPMITNYLFLVSIAFVSHLIMDLEGLVPLFYPLDMRGYQLDFSIIIKQALPPIITDFSFGFVREPFNYDITYDHEAALITTLDVLFAILLLLTIILKSMQRVKNRITVINKE
ncbi:MAG: hypothetical protein ACXADY_17630 [Candidatus Hodarchaeales archaeon]|jgi:hypothetical protein